jgi:hypothetical protein
MMNKAKEQRPGGALAEIGADAVRVAANAEEAGQMIPQGNPPPQRSRGRFRRQAMVRRRSLLDQ